METAPSTSTSVASKKPVHSLVKHPAPAASHTLSRPRKRATDKEQDPTCAAATLRLFKQRQPHAPSSSSAAGGSTDPTDQASDSSEEREKAPIIPFDDLGKPTNPEDTVRREKEERKLREEQPEFTTGEDLGSSKTFGKGKKGKGKGKKKKYPNLSDLKKSVNISRSRLERKVINPSSMR
ncbi:unnamed protein product, partial [Coregonus sp. 'balchen']